MEQIINILIGLGGVGFFIVLILHGRYEKRQNDFFDTYKPMGTSINPPDIEEIEKELKNETPEKSVIHVNDLLNTLFPKKP